MLPWNFFSLFICILVAGSHSNLMKPDPIFCNGAEYKLKDGYNYKNQSCFYQIDNDTNIPNQTIKIPGCNESVGFGSPNFSTEDEFDFVQILRKSLGYPPVCVGTLKDTSSTNKSLEWDDGTLAYLPQLIISPPVAKYPALLWSEVATFTWIDDAHVCKRAPHKNETIFKLIKDANCQYAPSKCYLTLQGECIRNRSIPPLVNKYCKGEACQLDKEIERCPTIDPSYGRGCRQPSKPTVNSRSKKRRSFCKVYRSEIYGDALRNLTKIYYCYLCLYTMGLVLGIIGFACYWIEPRMYRNRNITDCFHGIRWIKTN